MNKLSQFWKELKRRHVIHVITVYASASFVLIELVNNLTEPLRLPPSLATIVIVVLAVGFPLAVILSWIYDLTGEGFQRTRSLEEMEEGGEKGRKEGRKGVEQEGAADEPHTRVPNAWKIATYISFVVILGLATLNIVGGSNTLRAGDIQSLVILPFENYTGDDQLENMVSGMHSLLIGDMGRISGLRVIGKTSSKMYRDAEMSAGDIARELNVDAVVEGTIMCLGDSVCMQFRLVNAKGREEQVWIGDFHEDKGKVLNLYNTITRQIADEVRIELTTEEQRLLAKTQTIDREAFDAYLESYAHWDDLSEESTRLGIEYLNTALETEPDWAPLWAGLAQLYTIRLGMGVEPLETGIPRALGYLEKAMELDPDYADVHFNNGVFGTWLEWDWDKGEQAFLKALTINPNDVMSRIYYAHLLNILQRNREAFVQGKIAVDLDPLNPLVLALYGSVFTHAGEYDTAVAYLDKALALDPEHYFAHGSMVFAGISAGEYERVFRSFKYNLPFQDAYIDTLEAIYREQGFERAYVQLVERFDSLGIIDPVRMAVRYANLHQYDKVLDQLELGFEIHEPNMPYIGCKGHGFVDSLRNHERYLALMEKMQLPLPEEE